MGHPGGSESSKQWWSELTEEEARNPLGAIFNVQTAIGEKEDQLEKDKEKLGEYYKRLKFLREIVDIRMGTHIHAGE